MEVTVCREGCSREERSRREGPLASGVAGGNREGEERQASGVGGGGPRDPGGLPAGPHLSHPSEY